MLLCVLMLNATAQDKLLLTNGKYRKLKGKVVYFDHEVVLWQTAKQVENLKKFEDKRAERESTPEAKSKAEEKARKKAEQESAKQAKAMAKLEQRKQDFESDVKFKMETLSPADFEKWKIRETDKLKQAETDRQLKAVMAEKLTAMQARRKESLQRGRFASAVPREKVFSILRPDSAEQVIYTADTLGVFADGAAEVEYGVAEMRMYIKGRQDGRKHSVHDIGIGAGVGLAAGLLNTWYLDAFYAPITPAVCIVVMSIINTHPSPKLELTANEMQSLAYIDGYERSAKGRKILMFAIGAVGGLGAGISAGLATAPMMR